jgi:uncharacterized protein DUF2190
MTPFRTAGLRIPGLQAGANLASNQFRFVKPGATELQVIAIAAATDKPIGVQYDVPTAAGQPIEVQSDGVVEVVAGAAIALGAEVQTNATGKAITATTGGTVVGRALIAAAADGDRISVLLNCVGGRVL